uniref:APC family permease n=1 Tax=Sinorhizobium chiapasense TaxID=501572 RepID=UPI002FE36824
MTAIGTTIGAAETEIKGDLGTLDIILATLAYAAPLAATAGYLSLSVGFGSGIATPLSFLVTMVIILVFSVGYCAMSRRVPNPGAFYAYIAAGLGRPAGLGTSFLMLFSYGAIAVGFYAFAGSITKDYVEAYVSIDLPWWCYAGLFWAAVGFFAYFRIELSAKILGYLLILEVIAVVVFNWLVLGQVGIANLDYSPFSIKAYAQTNIGLGILFTVILFIGFEATAIYREEIKDPDRVIPRATYLVVLFIGVFYSFTSWMLIQGIGLGEAQSLSAADPAGVFLDTALRAIGPAYNEIVNVLLLTSAFAAHLAIQNVIVRYVYSLSKDGVFPKFLGVAHDKHNSPSRSSVATSLAILAALVVLVVSQLSPATGYAWFGGVGTYGILLAMLLTSAACAVYFFKNPEGESVWRSVAFPVASTLLLGAANVIAVLNFDALTGDAGLASKIMLASVFVVFAIGVVLAVLIRGAKPDVYLRIGRQ